MSSFVLPRPLLPLLNQSRDQHWSKRYVRKKTLATRLAYEAGVRQAPVTETRKMRLTIERFCIRLPDFDNMVGGVKEAVDVLKEFGVIADDDPAHLDLVVRAVRVSHYCDEHTRIKIEAC